MRRPFCGKPDARCSRCRTARPRASRRGLLRRAPNATATRARRRQRRGSCAPARRRDGNTSGRERRMRPVTSPPARRCSSVGRRPNHRGCVFRSRQHETPSLRMAIFLLAYTDARSASTIPRARSRVYGSLSRGVFDQSNTHMWAPNDSKLQNLVYATTFCRPGC